MTEIIVHENTTVPPDKIYLMAGTDYQQFGPPISLLETGVTPTDYALLLNDYIKLDGTKELLRDGTGQAGDPVFSYTWSNLDTLLNNIRTLRNLIPVSTFTPDVPLSFNKPTTEMANDLERILHDVHEALLAHVASKT